MTKKIIALLLCLTLCLLASAWAEDDPLFTTRDLEQNPDLTGAQTIELQSGSVTIDRAGVYVLTGTLEDGQIVVEAGAEDSIQLVLQGVSIHCSAGPAIHIAKAEKVFITLGENTENTLCSEGPADDQGDGVIYSKADLTLNGSGSLELTAPQGQGIVCKDSLAITGGSYTIQAAGHGINGKDAVSIADGSFAITTGGGSQGASMKVSDTFGFRGNWQQETQQETQQEEIKAKGIKSDGPITVLAGSFTLDCADDAVHAGADITLSGGQWSIRSADDAIHSDQNVTIGDGSFQIPYCYEGIEGKNVTIDGGTFTITSVDDGLNATGEDSLTGMRMPGMDTGAVITVNGGTLTVVSDGDCLDSNGTIVLNGGILNLTCNGNGNTALDSESGITNNGAQVTTNDGSENGGGFGRGGFGGGKGGFGGKQGTPPEGFNRGNPPDGAAGSTPPDGSTHATPPSSDK